MGILAEVAMKKKKFLGTLIAQSLGTSLGIIDENEFFDDATIEVAIEQLKEEYSELQGQLSKASTEEQKEISQVQKGLEDLLILYASNSFKSIEWCKKLIDQGSPLLLCINALDDYSKGDKGEALKHFQTYYEKNPRILHHFLINKSFGELLYMNGNIKESIPFFHEALKVRPENFECYTYLEKAYKHCNRIYECNKINECMEILGG